MSTLQRGILKYYIDGKFFQRIEEAKTPEELDSIYNELNADWEKEVVPISQDILDLFAYNKHISKELFEKVMNKITPGNDRINLIKKIYTVLGEYDFIKMKDLLQGHPLTGRKPFGVLVSYLLENNININISDALLFVIEPRKTKVYYSGEQITYFWERRNEISDNDQKKLFVKKILKQRNVSKEILFQAFEEFKNDIDMVVEVFVNGIEYPELFNKVLEIFPKDAILEKIKSNLNSMDETDEIFYYGVAEDFHTLMSLARIADDNTLKRILYILNENDHNFHSKEIFNSQDEQEILVGPNKRLFRPDNCSIVTIKIFLSMSKNPNASLETLKYIVQSTNDIETLYYCIVNSGRNLEIFELINKKGLPPVQEDLKHNEVLAYFNDEMQEISNYNLLKTILELAWKCDPLSAQELDNSNIMNRSMEIIDGEFKNSIPIYGIITRALIPSNKGNEGNIMDKIRESIKNLSFETISLGGYSSDNFVDLQSKEKAYFECLVNYGLVNDNDVRKFLETCLGEKYLRRYVRDIALFSERGLDLSQTSKGAPQRG